MKYLLLSLLFFIPLVSNALTYQFLDDGNVLETDSTGECINWGAKDAPTSCRNDYAIQDFYINGSCTGCNSTRTYDKHTVNGQEIDFYIDVSADFEGTYEIYSNTTGSNYFCLDADQKWSAGECSSPPETPTATSTMATSTTEQTQQNILYSVIAFGAGILFIFKIFI